MKITVLLGKGIDCYTLKHSCELQQQLESQCPANPRNESLLVFFRCAVRPAARSLICHSKRCGICSSLSFLTRPRKEGLFFLPVPPTWECMTAVLLVWCFVQLQSRDALGSQDLMYSCVCC